MEPSSPETYLENVGGNCVIVTTLKSCNAASQNPQQFPCFSQAEARPLFNSNNRCPPPLPPASGLNSSVNLDEAASGAFKKADLVSSCPMMSHENALPDTRHNENHWKSSSEVVSPGLQALAPMDATLVPSFWAVKRTPHLGPLVIVKRPQRTDVAERVASLSEVEKMSHQSEVESLRIQLERSNERVEAVKSKAEQNFLERVRQVEETHREEERCRRQQFQEALSGLRAENEELMRRVKSMEDNAGCTAVREREKMQSEWSSRFLENEDQWKQRLSVAQKQWGDCVDEQVREKHEALRQVQELAHVVTELEIALQRVTREKCWAEQQYDTLLSSQHQGNSPSVCVKGEKKDAGVQHAHEGEVSALRRALKEAEGREAALMVQLEACGKEAAVQEDKFERRLYQVREELENERRRGSDIVKLYSGQVESLHQQLNDALRRSKQLTKELMRFQE
ncbi:hypothetical protein TraAM80_04528 [Trypanosoma rangeli]|uniref:Uncharacterized protein n=1 Tax=Trypanosoma rangeli TaxID=5698 RepID=A0A422NJ18_TRYRA|nr:uncharacterized protein TraAM80_04528 [Trypanosoma rangeli]RNF05488.1 hypothetical protein TraAM80_04528 [Trypanosoma rangeli]|eukprot:RNF05488.1 hypothetical protein TraAM80_04528 [Trypanosoma rangeli]